MVPHLGRTLVNAIVIHVGYRLFVYPSSGINFHIFYFSRSSSSIVTLWQVLEGIIPILKLEYRKYALFHIFLLHALTYWTEIVHMLHCDDNDIQIKFECRHVAGVRPAVRPSIFSALSSYVHWQIQLKGFNLTLLSLMFFYLKRIISKKKNL